MGFQVPYIELISTSSAILTRILRPTRDGSELDWIAVPHALDYENVKEEIADEDATYVRADKKSPLAFVRDRYIHSPAPLSAMIGYINYIKLHARIREESPGPNKYVTSLFRFNSFNSSIGVSYIASKDTPLCLSYHTRTHTLKTNPTTGLPWAWGNFYIWEFGGRGYVLSTGHYIYMTQFYIEVNYSLTLDCRLPKPQTVETNHDRIVNMLNLWHGVREIYDISRSGRTLAITGKLWDGCTDGTTSSEDIIQCIRQMAKAKVEIAIAGMRWHEFNTRYHIKSFNWVQNSKCNNNFDWLMELEFSE